MKPEDARKLLGGYATGTLTEEERQALFQAALDDQELFNALASEHELKELLDDPATRARLLAALSEPEPWFRRLFGWIARPVPLAVGGAAAIAILAAVALFRTSHPPAQEIAMMRESKPVASPATQLPRAGEPSKQDKLLAPSPRVRKDVPTTPVRPPGEFEAKSKLEEPRAFALSTAPKPPEIRDEAKGGVVGGVIGGFPSQPAPPPAALPESVEPQVRVKAASEAVVMHEEAGAEKAVTDARFRAVAPAPIRYRLVREEVSRLNELKKESTISPGDQVHLVVEAAADGHLYAAFRIPGEPDAVLFNEAVRNGKSYTIPGKGSLPVRAGVPEQKIVLSFTPGTAVQSPVTALTMSRRARVQAPVAIEIPLNVQP